MAVVLVTALDWCHGRLLRPESDAKRLYDDKFRGFSYNKLIRPVSNTSDKLTVRIGLRLTQIIDVVSSFCLNSDMPNRQRCKSDWNYGETEGWIHKA